MTINPIEHPELWDRANIGGIETPGIVEITGASRPWKWTHKEPKGSSGGTSTLQGLKLQKGIKIKVKLWKPDHFAAWKVLTSKIEESNADARAPKPLGVAHPDLSEHDIRSVVVEEIGGKTNEGNGLYSYTLSCTAYKRPVPSGGTAKGNGSSKSWKPLADAARKIGQGVANLFGAFG